MANSLGDHRRVWMHLLSRLDCFSLCRFHKARPLRIGKPRGIVTFGPTFNEQFFCRHKKNFLLCVTILHLGCPNN